MNQEHRLITLIKSGEGSSLEFKNPVIGAFFREIHRADELGSGMRNMMKYGQAYGGGEDPQLIEGDVFRIFVKVPEFGAVNSSQEQKEATKQGGPVRGPVTKNTPGPCPRVPFCCEFGRKAWAA